MKGNIIHTLGKMTSKHAPELLTGPGIAGMFAAVVLAAKATPKAVKLIEERETEKDDILTKSEIVKVAWKCYIPCAAACIGSAVCLIAANAVHTIPIRRETKRTTAALPKSAWTRSLLGRRKLPKRAVCENF